MKAGLKLNSKAVTVIHTYVTSQVAPYKQYIVHHLNSYFYSITTLFHTNTNLTITVIRKFYLYIEFVVNKWKT